MQNKRVRRFSLEPMMKMSCRKERSNQKGSAGAPYHIFPFWTTKGNSASVDDIRFKVFNRPGQLEMYTVKK